MIDIEFTPEFRSQIIEHGFAGAPESLREPLRIEVLAKLRDTPDIRCFWLERTLIRSGSDLVRPRIWLGGELSDGRVIFDRVSTAPPPD